MPAISSALKQEVKIRAQECCEYCLSQNRFSPDSFSIEHIVPLSKNGTSESNNLAYACQGCNSFKYSHTEARDPLAGKMEPLFHPRQQIWSEHFIWSEDYTLMIGLTAAGRATIDRMKLNRLGLVNFRRVLHALDEHPPKI